MAEPVPSPDQNSTPKGGPIRRRLVALWIWFLGAAILGPLATAIGDLSKNGIESYSGRVLSWTGRVLASPVPLWLMLAVALALACALAYAWTLYRRERALPTNSSLPTNITRAASRIH